MRRKILSIILILSLFFSLFIPVFAKDSIMWREDIYRSGNTGVTIEDSYQLAFNMWVETTDNETIHLTGKPTGKQHLVKSYSTPIIVDNIAYVASTETGTLFAIDMNEVYSGNVSPKVKWSYGLGGNMSTAPSTPVFYGRTEENSNAPVLTYNGIKYEKVIFYGTGDKMYAINAEKGNEITFQNTTVPGEINRFGAHPLVYNGKLYIGSWNKTFYIIDLNNNFSIKNKVPLNGIISASASVNKVTGDIVVSTDKGYNDGSVYILDPLGNIKMQIPIKAGVPGSAIQLDSGNFVVVDKESRVYKFDKDGILIGINEVLAYSDTTKDGYGTVKNKMLSAPALSEDGKNLYFSTYYDSKYKGHVYQVDLTTMKLYDIYKASSRILSSPTLINGGIFFITVTGDISLIEQQTGNPIPWLTNGNQYYNLTGASEFSSVSVGGGNKQYVMVSTHDGFAVFEPSLPNIYNKSATPQNNMYLTSETIKLDVTLTNTGLTSTGNFAIITDAKNEDTGAIYNAISVDSVTSIVPGGTITNTISFTVPEAGKYAFHVQADKNKGVKESNELDNNVYTNVIVKLPPAGNLDADFIIKEQIYEGQAQEFTDASYNDIYPIIEWKWSVTGSDGTFNWYTDVSGNVVSGTKPTTFNAIGTNTVTLTIKNSNNQTNSEVKTFEVVPETIPIPKPLPVPPTAYIGGELNTFVGESITLNDLTKDKDGDYDPEAGKGSREWKKNGVLFSSSKNPSTSFSTAGKYTITLRANDASGLYDIASTIVNVREKIQVLDAVPSEQSLFPRSTSDPFAYVSAKGELAEDSTIVDKYIIQNSEVASETFETERYIEGETFDILLKYEEVQGQYMRKEEYYGRYGSQYEAIKLVDKPLLNIKVYKKEGAKLTDITPSVVTGDSKKRFFINNLYILNDQIYMDGIYQYYVKVDDPLSLTYNISPGYNTGYVWTTIKDYPSNITTRFNPAIYRFSDGSLINSNNSKRSFFYEVDYTGNVLKETKFPSPYYETNKWNYAIKFMGGTYTPLESKLTTEQNIVYVYDFDTFLVLIDNQSVNGFFDNSGNWQSDPRSEEIPRSAVWIYDKTTKELTLSKYISYRDSQTQGDYLPGGIETADSALHGSYREGNNINLYYINTGSDTGMSTLNEIKLDVTSTDTIILSGANLLNSASIRSQTRVTNPTYATDGNLTTYAYFSIVKSGSNYFNGELVYDLGLIKNIGKIESVIKLQNYSSGTRYVDWNVYGSNNMSNWNLIGSQRKKDGSSYTNIIEGDYNYRYIKFANENGRLYVQAYEIKIHEKVTTKQINVSPKKRIFDIKEWAGVLDTAYFSKTKNLIVSYFDWPFSRVGYWSHSLGQIDDTGNEYLFIENSTTLPTDPNYYSWYFSKVEASNELVITGVEVNRNNGKEEELKLLMYDGTNTSLLDIPIAYDPTASYTIEKIQYVEEDEDNLYFDVIAKEIKSGVTTYKGFQYKAPRLLDREIASQTYEVGKEYILNPGMSVSYNEFVDANNLLKNSSNPVKAQYALKNLTTGQTVINQTIDLTNTGFIVTDDGGNFYTYIDIPYTFTSEGEYESTFTVDTTNILSEQSATKISQETNNTLSTKFKVKDTRKPELTFDRYWLDTSSTNPDDKNFNAHYTIYQNDNFKQFYIRLVPFEVKPGYENTYKNYEWFYDGGYTKKTNRYSYYAYDNYDKTTGYLSTGKAFENYYIYKWQAVLYVETTSGDTYASDPVILGVNTFVDGIAPTVNVTPESSSWTKNNVSVNIAASDDVGGSGLKEVKYTWSNSTTKPTSGWSTTTSGNFNTSQTTECIWYLHIEAFDNDGNSDYQYYGQYKIDKTKSTYVDISINGHDYTDGTNYYVPSNTPITVQVTYTDTKSGAERTYLRLLNGSNDVRSYVRSDGYYYDWMNSSDIDITGGRVIYNDGKTLTVEFDVTTTSSGTFNVYTYNYDKVFNPNSYIYSGKNIVVIDIIPPTVNATPTSSNWTKNDVSVNITASDDVGGSGLKEVKYKWTNDTTKPTSGWLITTSGNFNTSQTTEGIWYLHVEAFDNDGNSDYQYYGQYKIDKTKPSFVNTVINGATYQNGTNFYIPANTSLTMQVTYTDTKSGAYRTYLRLVNGTNDVRSYVRNNGYYYDWLNSSDIDITGGRVISYDGQTLTVEFDVTSNSASGTFDIYTYNYDSVYNGNGYYNTGNDLIVDTQIPTKKSIDTNSIDNNTFEVIAYGVTDNDGAGVNNVRFPTWTTLNGQDDLIWYDGTDLGGGIWKVTVPISNHNNENGEYTIHIYGYDNVGNYGMMGSIKYSFNEPPTASFIYSPSVGYEGDTIDLTDTSTDPDGDILTDLWTVIEPDGTTYTDTTQNLVINNAKPGTYQVKKKVTDPSNVSDETNYSNIVVNQLIVTGNVLHTTLWNEHRIDYNQAKSGTDDNPRPYDTFWTGEKLILNATSTQIDPQSSVTPLHVQVQIINEAYSTLLNINLDGYTWTGELWDSSMMNKWGRNAIEPLTLRYTATYSNGTIKIYDATINMDSRENYWELHRKW